MKILPTLFTSALPTACCIAAALLSGCATGPKPASKAPPRPIPVAMVETSTPPPSTAALPAEPAATVPAPSAAPAGPITPAVTTSPAPRPAAGLATIKGSQETSILFDNFTAFIAAVDGQKIAAGRKGWETPLKLEAGHRRITVEFNRGIFLARATLEFEAATNVHYELKYVTDAELFGLNSYCSFWIVDLGTGKTVCGPTKSSVEKLPEGAVSSVRP